MDYRDELVVPDDEQPYALEYMVPGIVHRVDQKYQGDEQRPKTDSVAEALVGIELGIKLWIDTERTPFTTAIQ
jgi:hypothetical protein